MKNKRYLGILIVIAWCVFSLSTYYLLTSPLTLLMLFIGALVVTRLVSHLTSSTENIKKHQQKTKHRLNEEKIKKLIKEAQPKIESSRLESIKINAELSTNLDIKASKFGGLPFINSFNPYPKNNHGDYLYLLAQFNLSDLPHNKFFPNSGLLQFFITDNENFYMANSNPTNFQVKYISSDSLEKEPITDFSFLPQRKIFPFRGEYNLNFIKDNEIISITDNQFTNYVTQELLEEIDYKIFSLKDYGLKVSNEGGHKIGGYGSYPQGDKRPSNHLLLFQMDSINEIMWGDSGTAHFFIKTEDLEKLNFENVIFNWDCY